MFSKMSLAFGTALAVASSGAAHASMIGDQIGIGNFDPFGMFTFDVSTTVLGLVGMESAAAVPVPAALPLLGTGIVALGLMARKRRKTSANAE